MSTIPRNLILLKLLYVQTSKGSFLTNEQLAKVMPAGYCARNDLCESGTIESRYGVRLVRYKPDGERHKRYSIQPDYQTMAREILTNHNLV